MLRVEINTVIEEKKSPIDSAIEQYHIHTSDILDCRIHHRSLDARSNRQARYVYQIDFSVLNEEKYLKRLKQKVRQVEKYVYHAPVAGLMKLEHRPVIVGFGPAGMASAYLLAAKGYQPIVIERGPNIHHRKKAVNSYWQGNELDEERNVQFGEGGAGAFSDGKLTTRIKDERVPIVLEKLIEAGADESISWMNHPHIGTDRFCEIDEKIRQKIIEMGGSIYFDTRLDDLIVENNKLKAIGNGSGDTYRMLTKYLHLENKPFAIGVRVEHLQSFINARQYRNIADYSVLPPAEYHLACKTSNGKGAYSFCMCPGGYVVPSESKRNTIVTNGMSYSKRDGKNANSAIVVQVDETDFGKEPLAGLRFQEELEARAYTIGNGKAPGETIAEYLNELTNGENIIPTYARGIKHTDVHAVFSPAINQSLEDAFHYTERIFPGFTQNGAFMTAAETRTSSPVRIVRDIHSLESDLIQGIYPCGEGAGYSGGIVSSAIDGVKCAEQIIMKYHPID
ncbi:MAG: hypothetical protein Q4C83_03520 [Candidatus Saccharibacteria bacterium]|nr:hypothetical protein [Candidatus Saccharibacteria bacterium]